MEQLNAGITRSHVLIFTMTASAFILSGCLDSSEDGANGDQTDNIAPSNFTFTALGPLVENEPDAPDRLTVVGEKLYFVAKGLGDDTQEVYVTDGSAKGTEPVTNLEEPTFGSSDEPHELTRWNQELYFATNKAPTSASAGTEDLVVLDSGQSGGVRIIGESLFEDDIFSQQAELAVAGDTLFVNRYTQSSGLELHAMVDGSSGSLDLVKNINETPGQGAADFEASDPEDLTAAGGLLYFTADDGDGRTLWVTDGSESGTEKLIAVEDDNTPGVRRLTAPDGFGERIFFEAFDDPWVSDGTAGGTEQLDPASDFRGWFARLDGSTVLFGADDQLWATDGTPGGTEAFADSPRAISSETAVLDGGLYFRVGDREVWTTDGTESGTERLIDMGQPGEFSSRGMPDYFTAYAGFVFFTADPIGEEGATGVANDTRLWITDGTEAGTQAIEPPDATQEDPVNDTWHDAFRMQVHDGALYLSAEFTAEGRQLWRVDDGE